MRHFNILSLRHTKLWNPVNMSVFLPEALPLFLRKIIPDIRIVIPILINRNQCIRIKQHFLSENKIRIFPRCNIRIECLFLGLPDKPVFLAICPNFVRNHFLYIILRIQHLTRNAEKSSKMFDFLLLHILCVVTVSRKSNKQSRHKQR